MPLNRPPARAAGQPHCSSSPRASSPLCAGRPNFGGKIPSSPFPSLSLTCTHTRLRWVFPSLFPDEAVARRLLPRAEPPAHRSPCPHCGTRGGRGGGMERGDAEPPQKAVTLLGKRVRRTRRYIQSRGSKKLLSPRPASPPPHPPPAPFASPAGKNKRRAVLKPISENLQRRESFPGEADVCSVCLAPPETC